MKYIDVNTSHLELEQFLRQLGWLHDEVILKTETPGEGNMNVVIRVKTTTRSFILKQSRPYVQKYQEVQAPIDRIDTEYQFYKAVKGIGEYLPVILAYSKEENLLMMQDLGKTEDMTHLYQDRKIKENRLSMLVEISRAIHKSEHVQDYPDNLDLRLLNHQHIFVLPFIEDNGFHLDEIQEGLDELSLPFKNDGNMKDRIEQLGKMYLSDGNYLLHGDYYPGSWMSADDKIYVLDPEFSFVGFREFDLGIMCAHLIMAVMKEDYSKDVLQIYSDPVDDHLVAQMTGIEILRRLIGLAQLPLERSLDEKEKLMELARKLILS